MNRSSSTEKKYLDEDYRDTVEITEVIDAAKQQNQGKEDPHSTTIQKYCPRNQVLHAVIELMFRNRPMIGVNESHVPLLGRPGLPVPA